MRAETANMRAKTSFMREGFVFLRPKIVLLCPFGGRITGAETTTIGAGMAFFDTSGSLYDSFLLYDDTSSPQPSRKRMSKVKLGLQNLTPDQKIALANTIKTA